MSSSVEDLVSRARAGDGEAMRELLLMNRGLVAAVLFRSGVRQAAEVEDLAQEVAVKAWRALRRLRDASQFSPWVGSIARNVALDHLRRHRPLEVEFTELAGLDELDPSSGADPAHRAEHREELERVLRLIGQESEINRDMLLGQARGASIAELARSFRLAPAAVKMRLSRIRARLRRRLLDEGDGRGDSAGNRP